MSDGAAAIIGVIVGGFITLGTSYGLVRRREKRDARGARLMIRSEFDEAATAISYAFESNSGPPDGRGRRGRTLGRRTDRS
jgi:hypothetical protein